MTFHELENPYAVCPGCGNGADTATNAQRDVETAPIEGDLMVCWHCKQLNQYIKKAGRMELVEVTREELAAMIKEDPLLQRQLQGMGAMMKLFQNLVTCPTCGSVLVAANKMCRIDANPPKTGDLAICNYCTELCIMEVSVDEISVRKPTDEEMAELKRRFPNFDKQIEVAKTVIDNSKID